MNLLSRNPGSAPDCTDKQTFCAQNCNYMYFLSINFAVFRWCPDDGPILNAGLMVAL